LSGRSGKEKGDLSAAPFEVGMAGLNPAMLIFRSIDLWSAVEEPPAFADNLCDFESFETRAVVTFDQQRYPAASIQITSCT
jgi:hypothetical protein